MIRNNSFVEEKYKILPVNGVPASTLIQSKIDTYTLEYQVKVKNNDNKHIQSFDPDLNQIQDCIDYFTAIQSDMLNNIFDTFNDLAVSKEAYNTYYVNLEKVVDDSAPDPVYPAYFVYQQIGRDLNLHQTWLENYVKDHLRPQKTISNEEDKQSIIKHKEHHTNLAISYMNLRNDTHDAMKRKINDTVDLSLTGDMRLNHAKIHQGIAERLDPLSKTPNETISENDYRFIRDNLPSDAAANERQDNDKIIAIAKSMITIAPGFIEIEQQIAESLKNHTDVLLTTFMSCIVQRIETVSNDIQHHHLGVTKMVLILNVYLKIFRDIVPKLPLASSSGKVRYCKKEYQADELFSSKAVNLDWPKELQTIHNQYAEALLDLKVATEKFILTLVTETNERIIRYEKKPSQDLANEIMERVVGHKDCLINYKGLFKDVSTEGLSGFVLDKMQIDCSEAMITAVLNKIKDQVIPEIARYRVMHKMDSVELHMKRFAYLKNAHAKYFYGQSINEQLAIIQQDILESAVGLRKNSISQLAGAEPHHFNIIMRNILFLNDTFFKSLRELLNVSGPSDANLIADMATMILINPNFKTSRVIYNDFCAIVSQRLPGNEQADLMNLLPCQDFDIEYRSEPTKAQQVFELLFDKAFEFKQNAPQIKAFIKCIQNPTSITLQQYDKFFQTLKDNAQKFDITSKKDIITHSLAAYLSAYDIQDQYTHKEFLINFYHTLQCCLDIDKDATLVVLANSESFICHYPIARVTTLLETYVTVSKVEIESINRIHSDLVQYVLKSSTIPVNVNPFMNHMLILMNNRSHRIIVDPLNNNAEKNSETINNEFCTFRRYVCHYISTHNAAHDFSEKLSSYLDHMVSYGINLNAQQAVNLLESILLLKKEPFNRMQDLTLRIIHMLPVIPENSNLYLKLETLFTTAANFKANVLADALLDSDEISALLSQEAIEKYEPETQAKLSVGCKSILNHFNNKVRVNKKSLQSSADIVKRLNKQMRKLDEVLLMLDQLRKSNSDQHRKYILDEASGRISAIEDLFKSFFGRQHQQDSSLCSSIEKFKNEADNSVNNEFLMTELLTQYDRLVAMLLDRFISDIEKSHVDKSIKINYLSIVYTFIAYRHNHLCKDSADAVKMISTAIFNAKQTHNPNGFLWRNSKSDCEIFLESITPTCIMYKHNYIAHMTIISDRIVELGGTRPGHLQSSDVAVKSQQDDRYTNIVL